MTTNKFSQVVFTDNNVLDGIMSSVVRNPGPFIIHSPANNLKEVNALLGYEAFIDAGSININQTVEEFDKHNQVNWNMPDEYKNLNVVQHILDLCDDDAELQRCGEELLLYQDHKLFNLLRYLIFLVHTAAKNNIIMGVGRGSSVASFVLYKIKVHRINSMFYNLSIDEFLR